MKERRTRRLGFKEVEIILSILREVSETSTMKNCHIESDEETKIIAEKTRIWRSSNITYPLDKLIAFIDAKSKGKDCRCYTQFEQLCFHNSKPEDKAVK